MSPLEWWNLFTDDAAWHAELSRNEFLPKAERCRHQEMAGMYYSKARAQRDAMMAHGSAS